MAEAERLLGGDSPDPEQVSRLITILEEKLSILSKLDGEILELIEREEDIVTEIEEADAHNQGIHDLLLRMQKVSAAMSGSGSGGTRDPETGASGSSTRQARLTKLILPPFNGDIANWLSFWELYDAAVHSNSELTDVQKFYYLKSLVEGVAKEAIEGLSLSADSYHEAVDILNKRFGNKQKIIDRHMGLLLNMDKVSSASSVTALRRLYDGIETNTRALKALVIAEESYGRLLSSVLVQRLPQELRLIAGREIEGDWNLPYILKVIGRELEARERTTTPHEDMLQVESSARRRRGKASVAMLAATNRDNSTLACCYCQGNHPSEECMTVTQIEERQRILRTSGRCFMCLRKGHIVCECRSRNRCRTCKGRHHHSIMSISHTSE